MGALVTLDLPEDSPVLTLPWIITFGPLSDDEEWEPVVCGPYERQHALALAEEVIADAELMAVVEPVMPHVSVDKIREEIATAREMAAEERAAGDEDEEGDDLEIEFDEEEDLPDDEFDEEDEEDLDEEDLDEEDEEDLDDEDVDDEDELEDEFDEDVDDHEHVDGHEHHDGHEHEEGEHDSHVRLSGYETAPTPEEIRAGFARIAQRLTSEPH